MGGFDTRPGGILSCGKEKQIKGRAKQLIRQAGSERLILSADCSVLGGTPAEHLRWVREAAQEYAGGEAV